MYSTCKSSTIPTINYVDSGFNYMLLYTPTFDYDYASVLGWIIELELNKPELFVGVVNKPELWSDYEL